MAICVKGDPNNIHGSYAGETCMFCKDPVKSEDWIWVWMTPIVDDVMENPTAHVECLAKASRGMLTDIAEAQRKVHIQITKRG